MPSTNQHDLTGTIGTEVGRLALLKEIVSKVEILDTTATDDDLDLWWETVEVDRLVSGLTLATIAKLADPDGEGDPAGAWLRTSDETGDEPTRLTVEGREALRRIGAADGSGPNVP